MLLGARNLMFTLSNDQDQILKIRFRVRFFLTVYEPLE